MKKFIDISSFPYIEDTKAQLSGVNYFSKLDFKSAFWQLELDMKSPTLITFHANNKLCCYTRHKMGVKPAQAELNAALKTIFTHIPNFYLMHDDLIIATKSIEEHLEAIRGVVEVMKSKNLTLNPNKCTLGSKEIKFLGTLFSSEKVKPEPEKNKDLEDIEPPKNKKELKWFIYMMQSNTDSIPYFSKSVAPLRILLNGKERFKWTTFHQNVVHNFLQEFTLLTYFDIIKQTFTFTDAKC